MFRFLLIIVFLISTSHSLHSKTEKKIEVDFHLFASTNIGSSKFNFQDDYLSNSVRASNRKITFMGEMVFDSNISFILGYEHIEHRNKSDSYIPNYNVIPILFGANGLYDDIRISMYIGIKAYNVTSESIQWNEFNFVGGHLSVVSDVPYTSNLLRVGLAVDYSFDGTNIDEFGEPILLTGNFTSVEINFSLDILPLFKSLWSKH